MEVESLMLGIGNLKWWCHRQRSIADHRLTPEISLDPSYKGSLGSYKFLCRDFLYTLNLFVLLFLVTPCLVVAVQPWREWIPIKKSPITTTKFEIFQRGRCLKKWHKKLHEPFSIFLSHPKIVARRWKQIVWVWPKGVDGDPTNIKNGELSNNR